MDALVAQYSRPVLQSEAAEDLSELLQDETALSLKFAMPPIAQVSAILLKALRKLLLTSSALILASFDDG